MPFPKANEKQHHCPTGSIAHTLSKFTPWALAWSGWPRLPGLMSPTGCPDHGVDSPGLYHPIHISLHPRQKWANPTRQGDFSPPAPCFSCCLVHRHAATNRLVAGPGLQPYQQTSDLSRSPQALASISWFLSSQLSDPLFLFSIWTRFAASRSLGACASHPVFWLICLDICW